MYEPAAPDALLCVGGGKTLYVGSLEQVDWHLHGAPVFIAGVTGDFRLRMPCGDWISCRAAVIPAGVRHALDLGGEPLAAFYPEPVLASMSALTGLGRAWDEHDRVLVSRQAEVGVFRELHENAASVHWSGDVLDDLLAFALRRADPPPLDPRLATVMSLLDTHPDDLTRAETLALAHGLSVSRFLHLFTEQVGVPFRRYRIWNRIRAATRSALAGNTFTDAAIHAGFTDSAHFARCFRETFGVTATYVFGKIARATALPARRPAARITT
ncbi:MAG: AraC family transcriptional regulator [Burkholderiales bacterium]